MAARTLDRVGALTWGLLLSTRDTVPAPTPALLATSAIVTIAPRSRPSWKRFHPCVVDSTLPSAANQWKRFQCDPVGSKPRTAPSATAHAGSMIMLGVHGNFAALRSFGPLSENRPR